MLQSNAGPFSSASPSGPSNRGDSSTVTLVRIIAGLINAILRVVASVLTSGIGLLVTVLTILFVVAALGVGGVSGFGALRMLRRRRTPPPPK